MTTNKKKKVNPILGWLKRHKRTEVLYEVLGEISTNWIIHKNSSMAAAISYRAMFSLVPIILLLVFFARMLKSVLAIGGFIVDKATGELSQETIDKITQIAENHEFQQQFNSTLGIVLGLVIIVFGASTVFNELTLSFNTIWGTEKKPSAKVLIYRKLFAFLLVLGIGAFIVASVVLSWLMSVVEAVLMEIVPIIGTISSLLDFIIIPLLLFFTFAFLFKSMPNIKIKWKDCWLSAGVTTVLFAIGQYILSWYLKNSDIGSYFGSMASFIVFMLWVYYSAMIVLFGAELNKIYTYRYGSKSKKKKA